MRRTTRRTSGRSSGRSAGRPSSRAAAGRSSRAAGLGLVLGLALLAGAVGCRPGEAVAPAPPSALTPKDVVAAAKARIEQWRQAYEVRSLEALAELYAHDLDLVVVQEGTPYLGWASVESMLRDRLARASAIHVRLKDVQVISLGADVASAVATLTREVTEGATTVTESGTLTLVLRRAGGAGGRWVISTEHYSYRRGG